MGIWELIQENKIQKNKEKSKFMAILTNTKCSIVRDNVNKRQILSSFMTCQQDKDKAEVLSSKGKKEIST